MSLFKDRTVPHGWTRGEELTVLKFTGGRTVALISQANLPDLDKFSADTIACLDVRRGDEADADAWLKWWHE